MTDTEVRRINQWNIDSERSERVMHPATTFLERSEREPTYFSLERSEREPTYFLLIGNYGRRCIS